MAYIKKKKDKNSSKFPAHFPVLSSEMSGQRLVYSGQKEMPI